jgi:hypothetical protein
VPLPLLRRQGLLLQWLLGPPQAQGDMLSSAGDNGALPAIEEKGTTGNGAFAESNTLWREPTLGLSVKSSSPRVKKILSENKLSAKKFFAESKKKKLSAKKFFIESIFIALGEVILKNSLFHLQNFLSSTCTYTKNMFKFDAILSLFAIFKHFNSLLVIFSNTYDMNYKCMKS